MAPRSPPPAVEFRREQPFELACSHSVEVVRQVELVDEAIDLPSFRHPARAAYILGPEKGSLGPETLAICDHVIKIPTKFCINVATAAAIVLYDRTISLGKFRLRPEHAGGPRDDVELAPFESWRKPSAKGS